MRVCIVGRVCVAEGGGPGTHRSDSLAASLLLAAARWGRRQATIPVMYVVISKQLFQHQIPTVDDLQRLGWKFYGQVAIVTTTMEFISSPEGNSLASMLPQDGSPLTPPFGAWEGRARAIDGACGARVVQCILCLLACVRVLVCVCVRAVHACLCGRVRCRPPGWLASRTARRGAPLPPLPLSGLSPASPPPLSCLSRHPRFAPPAFRVTQRDSASS